MRSQKKQQGDYVRVMNSVGIEGTAKGNPNERVISIETEYGAMQVTIEGNIKDNHVFLTYHDIGMNHRTCFQRFFNQVRRSDNILKTFGVVHITAPGQHVGARQISNDIAEFDMDVLVAQIDKVLKHLEIKKFFAFGVGAGAYILGLYATRNPSRVKALVSVGATNNKCGWIEWRQKWFAILWDKVSDGTWKNFFMSRWFSPETIENNLDLIDFYYTELDRIQSKNLLKFVHGFQHRKDYKSDLKNIQCPAYFFTGQPPWQEKEVLDITQHLDKSITEWARFDTGLSVIIEEPNALIEPIQLMLNGMGIF